MVDWNSKLPYYEFFGEGSDLGEQLGKTFKEHCHDAFSHSPFVHKLIVLDQETPDILENLISRGKLAFPKFMEELYGIAAGADQDIRKIYIVNFRHSYNLGCSTAMLVQPDQLFLGHNEDHDYFMAKNSGIIKVERDDHTSFISHIYPGCIPGPSFWLNSSGMGMSGNAINEKKTNFSGIPKILCDRAIINSKSNEELIQILTNPDIIGGFSYNFFSIADWEMYNLETMCGDHDLTSIHSPYCHTNHYISSKFLSTPFRSGGSSDLRLQSLQSRISTVEDPRVHIMDLLLHQDVHVDHQPKESKNGNYKVSYGTTACTAIFSGHAEKVRLEVIPHNKNLQNCRIFELTHGEITKKS